MSARTATFTLGTAATRIVDTTNASAQAPINVFLSAASAQVFVGGANVNATTLGTAIAATTGTLALTLGPGDDLFAIAASGTPTIKVLTTGPGTL